jgi:hypothetical protein
MSSSLTTSSARLGGVFNLLQSVAYRGGRPRLRVGEATLVGGFVVQGRIGSLGHERTYATPT